MGRVGRGHRATNTQRPKARAARIARTHACAAAAAAAAAAAFGLPSPRVPVLRTQQLFCGSSWQRRGSWVCQPPAEVPRAGQAGDVTRPWRNERPVRIRRAERRRGRRRCWAGVSFSETPPRRDETRRDETRRRDAEARTDGRERSAAGCGWWAGNGRHARTHGGRAARRGGRRTGKLKSKTSIPRCCG